MADAADELSAMMIVNALRALEDGVMGIDFAAPGSDRRYPAPMFDSKEWDRLAHGRPCTVERQGDEDAYSCGKRVDAGARVGCRDCGR